MKRRHWCCFFVDVKAQISLKRLQGFKACAGGAFEGAAVPQQGAERA